MDGAGQPRLPPLPREPSPAARRMGATRAARPAGGADRRYASATGRGADAHDPRAAAVVGSRRHLAPALGTQALRRADRVRLERSLPADVLRPRRADALYLECSR